MPIAQWLDTERWQALLILAAPRVLAALVVMLVFWVILRATRPLLRGVLARARFAEALIGLLVDGLFKGAIIIIALITAASQLGINVTAALAGLGVAGIALGFAAQETVANMIAGFQIGDYVTTQGMYGRVQEITMRTTRIRTMENTYAVIPNKQIIGDLLVNHSMYGVTRVNVPVGIAYKEKIAEARAVLLPAISKVDGVVESPAPDVVAIELGGSSVNLMARVWISDSALEKPVGQAVLEASKVALDEAGIEIPFPHLQLFVEDVREPALKGLGSLPRFAAPSRS
jgi:small conductance mechanosensitive channel